MNNCSYSAAPDFEESAYHQFMLASFMAEKCCQQKDIYWYFRFSHLAPILIELVGSVINGAYPVYFLYKGCLVVLGHNPYVSFSLCYIDRI